MNEVSPADAGLPTVTLGDLKGGTPAQNADAIRQLLDGEKGPFRDIVLYNAGAALIVAGSAQSLSDGVAAAADAIDSGAAKSALERMLGLTGKAA